ncbi:KxYKxGKxW signal peptide domain-containing protein [Streptococcus hillyeri]|uniref:Uncharacterized protein n=1 Tax=Streptococcus hillyeri TaxID=2282420 RepID=A0A3L9DRW0_9STRE|nr:KxYKxGKxW signal peptide domain-containing protein [Streptococcus hillyeri]RLY01872.1 hypothetical protein EAF07_08865 [Streptococcus hillyeri]
MKQENSAYRVKMIKRKKIWVSVGATVLSVALVGGILPPTVVSANQTDRVDTSKVSVGIVTDDSDLLDKEKLKSTSYLASVALPKDNNKNIYVAEVPSNGTISSPSLSEAQSAVAKQEEVVNAKKEQEATTTQTEIQAQQALDNFKSEQEKMLLLDAQSHIRGGEITDEKQKSEVRNLVKEAKEKIASAKDKKEVEIIVAKTKEKINAIVKEAEKRTKENLRKQEDLKRQKEEERKEQERKAEEARKEQERKAEESLKAEELRQQEEERKALHTFKLDETVKLKAQAGMHYDSLKTPELKAELKESIVKAVAAIREASSKADVQKIVSDATAKLKDIVSRSMNLSQDKHEDLRQQEEAPKTQDMNDSQQDDSNQIITFQDPATKVSVSAKKKDFNGAVGVRVVPMRAAILGQAPSDSYDITLVDAKGELVQPTGPVTVTAPANGIVDKVYYVLDDMKESLPFTLNANGTVSFGVTHFSVYAIFYKQAMNDTKSSDKSTPKGDDKVEQKSEPKEHMKQEQKRSEVAPKSNANQKEPKVTHGIARKMTPSRRSNQLPRTNSEETSLISIMMSALGVAGILSLVAYVMKRRR